MAIPPAGCARSPALCSLFAGADRIVFNGDSLETRRSPISHQTDAFRQEFIEFTQNAVPRCIVVTGNHDPDVSAIHHLELLGGLVFITHGEVLFDDLVPWSRELPQIRDLFRRELAALPPLQRRAPDERLAACQARLRPAGTGR